jgi:hypothetical protein
MELTEKELEILQYCRRWIDETWARSITAVILDCPIWAVRRELEKYDRTTQDNK